MKTALIILEIVGFLLLLASLYFRKDWLLITAAVVMAICIVLTFSKT